MPSTFCKVNNVISSFCYDIILLIACVSLFWRRWMYYWNICTTVNLHFDLVLNYIDLKYFKTKVLVVVVVVVFQRRSHCSSNRNLWNYKLHLSKQIRDGRALHYGVDFQEYSSQFVFLFVSHDKNQRPWLKLNKPKKEHYWSTIEKRFMYTTT